MPRTPRTTTVLWPHRSGTSVECKIAPDEFRPRALDAFRERYPEGENFVVSPFVPEPWRMRRGRHRITVCTPRFVEGRAAVAWN